MRILVIDDAKWNQEAAHEQLGQYDLTVVGTIREAFELLHHELELQPDVPFDAVLTDLWMPCPPADEWDEFTATRREYRVEKRLLNCYDDDVKRDLIEAPAGAFFAILATVAGVPHVGILTDGDHHSDRLTALLDPCRMLETVPSIVFGESRYNYQDLIFFNPDGTPYVRGGQSASEENRRKEQRYSRDVKAWDAFLCKMFGIGDWEIGSYPEEVEWKKAFHEEVARRFGTSENVETSEEGS